MFETENFPLLLFRINSKRHGGVVSLLWKVAWDRKRGGKHPFGVDVTVGRRTRIFWVRNFGEEDVYLLYVLKCIVCWRMGIKEKLGSDFGCCMFGDECNVQLLIWWVIGPKNLVVKESLRGMKWPTELYL